MEAEQIATLLKPYLRSIELGNERLVQISIYVNGLLKWNARTNLTSIRDEEQIVQRHFGESLFAASVLLGPDSEASVIDVGSGAGFPGLPLKIFAPEIHLTLIESHGKKATFLREVSRALGLKGVTVLEKRAEQVEMQADLVTFRAVEKFEAILRTASGLVAYEGRLGMMVGATQVSRAAEVLSGEWDPPVAIPNSQARVVAVWRKTK